MLAIRNHLQNLSAERTGLGGRGKTEKCAGSIRDIANATHIIPIDCAGNKTIFYFSIHILIISFGISKILSLSNNSSIK